ncbi:MAG: adenylate/guanylate cyclase domain-containing protein [Polyangiaceae bacterium]
MLRVAVYYVAAVVALAVFGCEVCPLIHSLGRFAVGTVFAACFALAFALRWPLERALVSRAPVLLRPMRQFKLDFGLFIGVGVALTLYDRVVYGFYLGSGLRATLGCATIGLFCGLDTLLARERDVVREVTEATQRARTSRPASRGPTREVRPFSMTRRFAMVALSLLLLVTVDLLLLAMQDLRKLAEAPSVAFMQREIAIQSGVTLLVLFALTLNLVVAYARNLRLFLESQRKVLEGVAKGDLEGAVPVASEDEFAVIAEHTNDMIGGLRERAQIKEVFGKLVSPGIAQRLLEDRASLELGGVRRRVAVAFSDIRGFTSWAETAPPETVVRELNAYFTEMVEIVHAHGGVVDKFIGDGMMAVFGVDAPETAANCAVDAAIAMLAAVERLNTRLSQPIAIGVGLHLGDVVAGTIGAPDRLEYTFVGDTVNTAARIESMTKELGAPLLVSRTIHDALTPERRAWTWKPFGEQALKGKIESVYLFGLTTGLDERLGARP